MGIAALGDIADEDELKTGERREGMFMGMNALFTIPAQGLFIFFFTLVLELYGYDGSRATQTQEAIFGIRLGVSLLPVVFLAIGILALYFYPLHGESYKKMKEEVRIRYEQKLHMEVEKKDEPQV